MIRRWLPLILMMSIFLLNSLPAQPAGDVSFYHTDHLGSVRMLTDGNGAVRRSHDYLPFGEEAVAGEENQFKFTGQYRDETGRDYFGVRYYAASFGRFFSIDPAPASRDEPGTWNRYAYVTGNPLRYRDPDGRLKRDANGQIIFEPVQKTLVGHGGAPGVMFLVNFGYLIADDGRKIPAFKSLEKEDPRFQCDCHGLTFAAGRFWINNSEVEALLKGDQYLRTDKPQVGDIGVYRDARGDVVHSVTVASVDKNGRVTQVVGLGGIEMEAHADRPEPGPGGGWFDPHTRIEYWRKSGDARDTAKRRQNVDRLMHYKKAP